MNNRNPNIVLLMKDTLNTNEFIYNIKKTWDYECTFEISEQEKFINYQFKYNNLLFALSIFNTQFPEDIKKDIVNSKYASRAEDIYDHHTNFCILSVVGNSTANVNIIYASFTRIVMSLLLSQDSEECFVYDMKSKQAIDKEIYLKMFENMKSWYKNNEEIFPIDWYVNYIIYKDGDKFSAITLGFEAFNDYEIEIHNKELNPEEILKIMKYIVINVISRQDKIKNRDLVPIPIGENYDEGIVKQAKSKILNKETLVIIF